MVDGPTLADRIAHGPIPLDEALSIARQITEALEAAHEQGVIHRDLKPANIKLRPDGCESATLGWRGHWKGRVGPVGQVGPGGLQYRPDSPDRPDLSASPTLTSPALMTDVGRDPGHCRLHESRTGTGRAGRQAQRHLGVRLRALRTLMAATVTAGTPLRVTAVQPLFELPTVGYPRNNYDVAFDGKRFLVNTRAEVGSDNAITVVWNWTATLQQ
jgi:serine/threonine protein kinase